MVRTDERPSTEWAPGDRARVDIPDETDPNHRRYHGKHGVVIARIPVGEPAGEKYRLEFDTGGYADVRPHELRPPIVP